MSFVAENRNIYLLCYVNYCRLATQYDNNKELGVNVYNSYLQFIIATKLTRWSVSLTFSHLEQTDSTDDNSG